MKLPILRKWVRALRSGRYKQGTGMLKTLNGQPRFCCLGVLCELHAKATGGKWDDDQHEKLGRYLGEKGVLPTAVMRWAGLSNSDPCLVERQCSSDRASELNDSGKRFKTIAKLIEQAQKKKLI